MDMTGFATRELFTDSEQIESFSGIELRLHHPERCEIALSPDEPQGSNVTAQYLPECTLEFAKKHRSWGIPSQWKVHTRMEHGFFFDFVRKAQLEAFEDFCSFLEGKLQTL